MRLILNCFQRIHSQKLTEFENYCTAKRQRLRNFEDNKNRRTYCNFSQKEFENNVTRFILHSFVPYNTVELSFRKIFDGNSDLIQMKDTILYD